MTLKELFLLLIVDLYYLLMQVGDMIGSKNMTNPIIDKNCTKRWYRKGGLHRVNAPAVEHADGTKSWYRDGVIHREDGPAIEYTSGRREWYREGRLHREDGPAIEYVGKIWTRTFTAPANKNKSLSHFGHANGTKMWYRNGKLERKDGPAVVCTNGDREWHLNGMCLDTYHPNFGCFKPKSREEALERLNSKVRPYSYDQYVVDIDEMFPEGEV